MEMWGNVTLQYTHVGNTIVPHHTHRPIHNINCGFDINEPTTECDYIEIISWNADGLKILLSKSHLLVRNYDIICIEETWAKNYEQ